MTPATLYLRAAALMDAKRHCTAPDCGHPTCALNKVGAGPVLHGIFRALFPGPFKAVPSVEEQKAAVLMLCLMAAIVDAGDAL